MEYELLISPKLALLLVIVVGQPMQLCRVDLRKLQVLCGFDVLDRYRKVGVLCMHASCLVLKQLPLCILASNAFVHMHGFRLHQFVSAACYYDQVQVHCALGANQCAGSSPD